MIFRQLFDSESSTYTYLLGCERTREAALIDPVKERVPAYLRLLEELDLRLVLAIDTHVHADHVTALGDLRDTTGCITSMGEPARASCVSQSFRDGDKLRFGDHELTAIATPGHTDDSYTLVLQQTEARGEVRTLLFTGDTLLIRGTGRTDFQNGNASQQYDSLFGKLLQYSDDAIVYPAHDYKGWTVSSIGEERRHNPRLQVASREEYVELMNNLRLPTPKLMDVAVPANVACGRPAPQ